MKGLLLKDFYGMKVYLRQYVILLVFFMIFGISMGNVQYIMWMSLVLGLNIGFAAFPMDEAGGYAYMLSCPVGRKTCVQEKYLLGIIGMGLITVFSGIGAVLSYLLNGGDMGICLEELAIVLGIYFFFTAVLLPVGYRYGVEKARVAMLGMIIVPMVVVFLSVKLIQIPSMKEILGVFQQAPAWEQIICYGAFLFFAACLLVFFGSYLLSVRIFEGKEF